MTDDDFTPVSAPSRDGWPDRYFAVIFTAQRTLSDEDMYSLTDERMVELAPYVGGFLVTFVEREGRLGGTDLERVKRLVELAGDAKITIAGGVTTAEELSALDRQGVDAQVGMALYTGRLGLAEALTAPMVSDRPDGLWPTVVVDEHQRALGFCYSNLASVQEALETGKGVYWSRRRGLWRKGESSGNAQELIRVDLDCDRDALRFTVRQAGPGFCHMETTSCWGPLKGLPGLAETLAARQQSAPLSRPANHATFVF